MSIRPIVDFTRELRLAYRAMTRRRGFAAIVIATLAVGVAANSAIFSLVDAVLLRSLPHPGAEHLVAVTEAKVNAPAVTGHTSPGRLEDWQRLSGGLESVAGYYRDSFTDTTADLPERVSGAVVSPGFFSVLGTAASLGRVFQTAEESFGGPASVVISDGYWRRRFSANPSAIGQSIRLGEQSYTVVGVMPPSFRFPSPATELWVSKQARPALLRIREARFYSVVARLKNRIERPQAEADLMAVQHRLGQEHPRTDAGLAVSLRPLNQELIGNAGQSMWLLLGAVFLILLLTCANVGCLLLAHCDSRSSEMATRFALGAGRSVIVRQLLAEGIAYSLAGGTLGLLGAAALVPVLKNYLPDFPRIHEVQVDWRIAGFTAALMVVATVLFSLAPALHMLTRSVNSSLTRHTRHQRLTKILVTAQFALATVLLAGASLLLHSFLRLQDVPLGFHPQRVLSLRISASFTERPEDVASRQVRLLEKLAALPGVESVAMSTEIPASRTALPQEFHIVEGSRSTEDEKQFAGIRAVSADYFRTLAIPILGGETCRMDGTPERPFAALVNRKFVDRYFAGGNPVGASLIQGPRETGRTMRITGVVENVREEGFGNEPQPLIYNCGALRFWPDPYYLVRAHAAPAPLTPAIRRAIQEAEPLRAVYDVQPLVDALDQALSRPRFQTAVVAVFSAIALLLAAVGLNGVLFYAVLQRTRETGIRLALGAQPAMMLRMVMGEALKLAACGALVGFPIAVAAGHAMRAFLFGVESYDFAALSVAAVLLAIAATLAAYAPARRASRVDPVVALKYE